MHISQNCANCHTDTRCRKREFSEQAWSALLAWEEIEKAVVDQPICGECYDELREILIDRAAEIEFAHLRPKVVAKPAPVVAVAKTAAAGASSKKAEAPAPKKAPASASKGTAKKAAAPAPAAKKSTGGKKPKKVSKMAS